MNNDLATLAALGVTRTRFASLLLKPNDTNPTVLGQGECKAVLLKANFWNINQAGESQFSNTSGDAGYLYYGDANQQSWEYLVFAPIWDATNSAYNWAGNTRPSELIICSDLNQVWLRLPTTLSLNQPTIEVQVMILE